MLVTSIQNRIPNVLPSCLGFLSVREIAVCRRVKAFRAFTDRAIRHLFCKITVDNEQLRDAVYYLYSGNSNAFLFKFDLPTRKMLAVDPGSAATHLAFKAICACASEDPGLQILDGHVERVTEQVRSLFEPVRSLSLSHDRDQPQIKFQDTIEKLLHFTPHLTSLTVTYGMFPELRPHDLGAVAKRCPELRHLTVRTGKVITSEQIKALASFSQLRELVLFYDYFPFDESRQEPKPGEVVQLINCLPCLNQVRMIRRIDGKHQLVGPKFVPITPDVNVPDTLTPSPLQEVARSCILQRPKSNPF